MDELIHIPVLHVLVTEKCVLCGYEQDQRDYGSFE